MTSRKVSAKRSANLLAKYRVLMARFDAYIDANMATPLSCNVCAHDLGMSPGSLLNVVRAIYGTSAENYISTRRLSAVRTIIQEHGPACRIGTVANAHGFQDLEEFSDAYSKQFDESPSETAQRAAGSLHPRRKAGHRI